MVNFKDYVKEGRTASDPSPLLADAEAFAELVNKFTEMFAGVAIDKVACIEGKGFILGGAIASKLNVGVVPIRYKDKLQREGEILEFKDYSGTDRTLGIVKDLINPRDKVLLIDDWIQTGNTLRTAIKLIENLGGQIVGIGVFMDDTTDEFKIEFAKYNYKFVEKSE